MNILKTHLVRSRSIAVIHAGIALLAFCGAPAMAQNYPSRPISVLSSVTGGAEAVERVIFDKIKANTGATLVFEARPGGAGAPALSLLKAARPDGHTIGITYASAMNVNPFIAQGLDFDPVKDFIPVTILMENANVIAARADFPAKDLRDLIAMAKAKPESVRIGISGAGNRLFLTSMMEKTGVKFLLVPYRSSSEATTLTLGGHIDAHMETVATVVAMQGRLKALAYGGSAASPLLPGVPIVRDIVPGLDSTSWFGVIAPAGTPADRVAWLHREFVRALKDPAIIKLVEASGSTVVANTPEEFAKALRLEIEANKPILQKFDKQ